MSFKKTLNCLIVEDEPLATEVLEDFIAQVPFLDLKATSTDALQALEVLRKQHIDVMFLDIHLPRLKGIDFLKSLHQGPKVILTTAYDQYAIDAFALDVVDYLLKPITFSRFLKAVNKLDKQTSSLSIPINDLAPSPKQDHRPYLFFNENKKMVRVYIDDILYIESLKDYCKIHTTSGYLVTRGHLQNMVQQFQKYNFLRVHRSFLVPIDKISAFSAGDITIGSHTIPIGRSYKELVNNKLNDFFRF